MRLITDGIGLIPGGEVVKVFDSPIMRGFTATLPNNLLLNFQSLTGTVQSIGMST